MAGGPAPKLSLDRQLEPCVPPILWLLDVPIEDEPWARLDPPQRRQRILDGVKRLLQAAPVIGTDVPWGLLQAVADEPGDRLRRGLAQLQATEFLYETRLFPDLEYTFRHALTHISEIASPTVFLIGAKTGAKNGLDTRPPPWESCNGNRGGSPAWVRPICWPVGPGKTSG